MRIIVSDTSCMIDLRKAAILEDMLRLPYTFVMPDTLFDDEWLSLSRAEKRRLRQRGLEVRSLSGPQVVRAAAYFNRHRRLKLKDCFALTLAEDTQGSILLTGDALLRRIAEEKGIEGRGVLWVTDELETHEVLPRRRLRRALRSLYEDELVFLPKQEILRRLQRLSRSP